MLVVAVSLELEDGVDQVLERARAGDGAVLGHEAAAQHAVELGDAGGNALALLGLDVDKPQRRLRGSRRAGSLFLDERPEGAAGRALAEPPPGRVAAVRAREFGRSLCHRISLRPGADADCAYSVTSAVAGT